MCCQAATHLQPESRHIEETLPYSVTLKQTDQDDKRRIPQVQKQQAVEGQEADRHPDIVHENTHARRHECTYTNKHHHLF